jgi:DNA-binding GntR family transcriptional regulator
MEIDYQAAEPPYRQIAAWLRERIRSGELQPGQRLPTERDLTQEFGVAATTTRRAYRLLAQEGWVTTTPGRGTHSRGVPPQG